MHDLFSPTFSSLYDTYRDQTRIDSVERIQLESTTNANPLEFLHGYPVVFSSIEFPKKTEVDVVHLLESHCPDLRIQVRRPSFDAPSQYLTEREIEEISMVDYLRGLRSTVNSQQSTVNSQQSTVNSQVRGQPEVTFIDGAVTKDVSADSRCSDGATSVLAGWSRQRNTASQRLDRQFRFLSLRHQAMDPISSERCSISVHGETTSAHRFCHQPGRPKESAAGSISAILEREINHSGCQCRRNVISASRLGTPRRKPYNKLDGKLLDVTNPKSGFSRRQFITKQKVVVQIKKSRHERGN